MKVGRSVPGACALVIALVACGDPARSRILPEVSVTDGIEVALHRSLPSPLEPTRMWTLRAVRRVRTVHEGGEEPLLYQPRSLLELRNGLLLVHDPMAPRPLVILDPSAAAAVARFGSAGKGPGELSGDIALAETAAGEFVVADRGNLQLHRYAPSGDWLGSERLELDAWPLAGGTRPGPRQGQVLAFVLDLDENSRWYELTAIDAGSGSAKPFVRFPGPPRDAEPGTIQRGRQLWTVLRDAVVTMWSTRPTIDVFDGQGRLLRRIELPLTQSRLTARDIEREVARAGGFGRQLEPGPRALTNMLYVVNDTVFGMFLSGLWHAAEDPALPPGKIYWRLFTVRGEYIGAVQQPEDFWALGRGRGTIWARLLDDRGYPVLTELELSRVESSPDAGG